VLFDEHTLDQQRIVWNINTPWAHSECGVCGQEEPYKKENSYRHAGNRQIPILSQNKVAWLDIQADQTCNGGCLICGPWNSSYWQSEMSKYQGYIPISNKVDLSALVNKIFDAIDTSELRLLQFLGGEPFLSDIDAVGIDRISNPAQCTLKYTTNGSIFPKDDRINQWKRFEKVRITLSIDGIGDRFDYLRYPLKWNVVERNIHRMLTESPSNTEFTINHSITPLNILYYDEFLEWVNKTFAYVPEIHCHPAYGVMNPVNGGEILRDRVITKYGEDYPLASMIHPGAKINPEFFEYINLWDGRRKTNWQKTFPAVADIENQG
jgi:sulfatase maturation enzyme AslB (radical SAM superfamily)